LTEIEAPPGAERILRECVALADQQASLRRVAVLAAHGTSSAEVFAAVAEEVARVMHLPMVIVGRYAGDRTSMTVIGAWSDRPHRFQTGTRWPLDGPSISAQVLATGRPGRTEDHAGAPIIVDGQVWGLIAAASPDASLPGGVEERLADVTTLMAPAIANSQAREDHRRLADEQAALRRVATLVAESATPADVFTAVASEIAMVLTLPLGALFRYEPNGTVTVVGAVGRHPFQPGTNWPLDGPNMAAVVRRTGRTTRVDDYADIPGTISDAARRAGFKAGVAAPIIVGGEVWGAACAGIDQRTRATVPSDAEGRLSQFTALVATAISNGQAREQLRRLAGEQAGLRRVATLVAEGATPADVLTAVAREVALVLRLPMVGMYRYQPDGTATVVGSYGEHPFQPGTNWPLDGPTGASLVRRTGRPARIEDYADVPGTLGEAATRAGFISGVGAPLVVDGEVWGVVVACTDRPEPLPPDAESRLTQFTALVATAISNTQAREDLRRLADEQGALRRLATLVAEAADSRVVFDAVCEETGRVLGATSVNLARFTPDGFSLIMAGWSVRDMHAPAGTRVPVDGDAVGSPCPQVGAPVVVEGRVWGELTAACDGPEPLPAGAEHRLANFAELIATAVSNAAARAELMASRVRIVEAADQMRRRVVRDLHDGAQQRLVHTVLVLQDAHDRADVPAEVRSLLESGLTHVHSAISELRELAYGIHPEVLTHNGLAAAVQSLADRAPLAVDVEIADERYPTPVESAAYFVAAEALTNVAKHASAPTARITINRVPAGLRLVVEDDGVGGARAAPGRGLSGLGDRLAALGGRLAIDSPPGGGTRVSADIPLPPAA
jgi:signal transduction histidine kinase